MSDAKLKWESEISDVARANAKLIHDYEEMDKQLKGVSRSAKRAGRDVANGMNKASRSAKSTRTETDTLTGSVEKFGTRAVASAAAMTTAIIGPAGAMIAVQKLVAEYEKVAELQEKMSETSLTAQRTSYDTATLTGDVSQKNIMAIQAADKERALKYSISPQLSSSIGYYANSSFDGQMAETTAGNVAKTAAAYNLDDEAVKILPSVFEAAGADAPEKQQKLLNMIMTGASAASASPNEYIKPLGRMFALQKKQGFDVSQTLGTYNAMITRFGPDSTKRAGEEVVRAALVTGGRNTKAIEFLTEEQKKQATELDKMLTAEGQKSGVDYSAMTGPQRQQFAIDLYRKHESTGNTDYLKQLDSKGFLSLMLIADEDFQKKVAEVRQQAIAAAQSGLVDEMFGQYQGTDIAVKTKLDARQFYREADVGKKYMGGHFLNTLAEGLVEEMHADATPGESAKLIFGYTAEKTTMRRRLVSAGLYEEIRKMEQTPGHQEDPRYNRLKTMWYNQPDWGPSFSDPRNQPYLQTVIDETDNFQNLRGADVGDDIFARRIEKYFSGHEVTKEMVEEMKKNTEATNRLAEATERQNEQNDTGAGGPVFLD